MSDPRERLRQTADALRNEYREEYGEDIPAETPPEPEPGGLAGVVGWAPYVPLAFAAGALLAFPYLFGTPRERALRAEVDGVRAQVAALGEDKAGKGEVARLDGEIALLRSENAALAAASKKGEASLRAKLLAIGKEQEDAAHRLTGFEKWSASGKDEIATLKADVARLSAPRGGDFVTEGQLRFDGKSEMLDPLRLALPKFGKVEEYPLARDAVWMSGKDVYERGSINGTRDVRLTVRGGKVVRVDIEVDKKRQEK